MHLFSKRSRLRSRAPRWPSKDYRDYLTPGARSPRPRASEAVTRASLVEDRSGGSPSLTRIVGVQRENVLLVELHPSYVSFDRWPDGFGHGLAREACVGVTPDRLAVVDGEVASWTLALTMN